MVINCTYASDSVTSYRRSVFFSVHLRPVHLWMEWLWIEYTFIHFARFRFFFLIFFILQFTFHGKTKQQSRNFEAIRQFFVYCVGVLSMCENDTIDIKCYFHLRKPHTSGKIIFAGGLFYGLCKSDFVHLYSTFHEFPIDSNKIEKKIDSIFDVCES